MMSPIKNLFALITSILTNTFVPQHMHNQLLPSPGSSNGGGIVLSGVCRALDSNVISIHFTSGDV